MEIRRRSDVFPFMPRGAQAEFWSILALVSMISPAPASGVSTSRLNYLTFKQIGLATIANMGAEVGATTSIFPYTPHMRAYLNATRRAPVARAADAAGSHGFLSADEGVQYDEVIEIVSMQLLNITNQKRPDIFRICPNWSQLSQGHLLRIWLLLYPSSRLLCKIKDGKMNFPLLLLDRAQIAPTKTW